MTWLRTARSYAVGLARRRWPAALVCSAVLTAISLPAGQTSSQDDAERWRPALHFTPPRHFMNDPNGLVFLDGEYHLFYQHNPFGPRWGHMSWGHAVSADLLRWTHRPVALPEEDAWMIFSGSAVVDSKGTSGLCGASAACLVAIYTMHREGRQAQGLAYSGDRGRTWRKYAGNPVLDLGLADFRDPKVIWHEPTRRWVMAVAVPDRREVRFFASTDLRSWEPLSTFGGAGSVQGIWECPTLKAVQVEGSSETRWVLGVSVNDGAPAGGSGVQYFVGAFDGRTFVREGPVTEPRWADYGPDFYAAQDWFMPAGGPARTTWIGWMSNWQYANDEPTGAGGRESVPDPTSWRRVTTEVAPRGPWRGAMSLPRDLALRRHESGWLLVQRPVEALDRLRAGSIDAQPSATRLPADLRVTIAMRDAAVAGVRLRSGAEAYTTVAVDREARRLRVDRTRSGATDFHESFARTASAPLTMTREVALRIIVDASSVEVFAEDGARVITARIFPPGGSLQVEPFSDGGTAHVDVQ